MPIIVNGNPTRNRPMLHIDNDVVQNPRRVISDMEVQDTAAIDWVCKIVDLNRSGNRATGFLVEENLIMTNDHVLKAVESSLKEVEVWFGWHREPSNRDVVGFSGEVVFRDEALDVAILGITDTPESASVAVIDVNHVPIVGDTVLVVGYPGESKGSAAHASPSVSANAHGDARFIGRKRVSPGKLVDASRFQLLHDCSTTNGSSGSPMVDKNSDCVIGIHSGWTPWWVSDLNRTIPMAVIAEALDTAGIPLFTEPAAEPVLVGGTTNVGEFRCSPPPTTLPS
ncbi:MAG: trypsin-like serine peptidase [Acidimicrobiales bacterium]